MALRTLLIGLLLWSFVAPVSAMATEGSKAPVVLLHGLARSAQSMQKMAAYLEANGHQVCNIDYPSTEHTVETLAANNVWPAIQRCGFAGAPINFVTHSMGGILVRELAATQAALLIGRVVMLSPPNHGSEVVDKLGDWAPFQWLNGPAGTQLGTAADSKPNSLGVAGFDVGVITGDRSINWILSTMLPGDDDGKVTVESAKLEGMADFKVMQATHPFIMRKKAVMKQVLHFLQHGVFEAETGA